MTSKSLKRRKTITHKKVRNHKKTIRGGKVGRTFSEFDEGDDESKDTPGKNFDLTKAEQISFAVAVAACIAVIIKVI